MNEDIRPIDRLEAFCCLQIERIETTLHHKYTREQGKSKRSVKNKAGLIPENDEMTYGVLRAECDIERRGRV